MRRVTRGVLAWALILGGVLWSSGSASAQGFSVTITVDENGHGRLTNTNGFNSPLPFFQAQDPGPGGLANVLTYDLLNPPGLTAGDVFLQANEPGIGLVVFDVVRFNPNQRTPNGNEGTLLFYSDNVFTFDSLADTFGPPGANYPNTITITENGPEGANGAIYTPLPGQPGFVAGAAGPVTYILTSDAPAVPEPASLCLLAIGTLGLIGYGVRRKKMAV